MTHPRTTPPAAPGHGRAAAPAPASRVPALAARTADIAPFQAMQVAARAAELRAAGHRVIPMSIGEPDFTAPPPVVAALERAARAGHTQYTAASGLPALRRAIATDYGKRHGIDLDPARIIVTAGASAALALASCALVDPGAGVLMTDPGYPCNRHFVLAFNGMPTPVAVDAQTRFQLTRSAVESCWRTNTRGVLAASPANPTGTTIPLAELAGIVDAVRARNGFTVVDEIYLGLQFDAQARSALELGDDVIVVNSFSKSFQMTGWRLGWLVVPTALAATFEKLAQNLYICASTLAQHAALACFDDEVQAISRQRREEFRKRRDFIVPRLRSIGLPVPVPPDGAFYIWTDCSAYSSDSEIFARDLLEQAFVSVVPGTDFGHNETQRHVRISITTTLEGIEEAIERIHAHLQGRQTIA